MQGITMSRTLNKAEPMIAVHGGKVHEAARRWGISPEAVIDFSANINPFGTPSGVLAAIENSLAPAILRAYPDEHAFVTALADKHDLTPDNIIIGNGSTALMFAVLRAILPARVLILEPAFDEYFRACVAVKAIVTRWLLAEETGFTPDFVSLARAIEKRQFDLIILNSPHNPTGMLYAREKLLTLVEMAEANHVAVMLDEAFIDYAPQASLIHSAAENPRFVVLRSLTKFYAMPGLRVGYAVCGAGLATAIREQIEAWSVSTVALEAGRATLSEEEYESQTHCINAKAREEFADALRDIGICVFPSAANFLMVRLPDGFGAELARWLEPERILIRQCDSFRGLGDMYIRLAVRSHRDNLRLVSLIGTWLKRNEQ
jgi:threonine-phosphate decarboxylase